MLRFRQIVLQCGCGYCSDQMPVGYYEHGRIYFAAYFNGAKLISVKYPLPSCLESEPSIEDSICEAVAHTHGNCIPGYSKLDCPNCGRQLQFVNPDVAEVGQCELQELPV
jgi:hypothetical protein